MPINLHDVYGHLIPGAVLVAIVAAPSGAEIGVGQALLALLLSYVLGVALSELARPWMPPADADGRALSDALLDRGRLPEPVRRAYADRVAERFSMDVLQGSGEVRRAALSMAEIALVHAGRADHARRMQSMAALCRGLAGALWIGRWWALGLAASALPLSGVWVFLAWVVHARASGRIDRMFDAGIGRVWLPLLEPCCGVAAALVSPLVAPGAALLAALGAAALWMLGGVARAAHERFAEASALEIVHGFAVSQR